MPIRVALLIESSRGYGRNLLKGIAAYARTHGPWSIYQDERSLGDAVPKWLERRQIDGIIARIESVELADELLKRECAVVDVRSRFSIPGIPSFAPDDSTIVRLACDHLRSRGVNRFAYCGFKDVNYSESRRDFLTNHLLEPGIAPFVYESPHGSSTDTTVVETEGMLDERDLGRWLKALPKQTGVIACNDIRGVQVLNICRIQGVKVPDDLAVIGVDNDELLCELSTPPLSSVAVDSYRSGYLAASVLDEMIAGKSVSDQPTLVNPIGVVARPSTDIFAIDDDDLVNALAFIRDNACEGILVDDVAQSVHLSRSTLDRRFSQFTNTTVKAEINRVRVERVKQLLVDTDYSLSKIATMTGFAHAEYMCTMFKEHTEGTPGEYRKIHGTIRRGSQLREPQFS